MWSVWQRVRVAEGGCDGSLRICKDVRMYGGLYKGIRTDEGLMCVVGMWGVWKFANDVRD